jgi:hypothetical protein
MRNRAVRIPVRADARLLPVFLIILTVSGCDLMSVLLPAPVITADAGNDMTATVGDYVTIEGNGSHERGDDDLSYSWYLVRVPAAVTGIMMGGVDQQELTFIPPSPGVYVFALVVSDGMHESKPDTVEVTAEP